MFKKFGIVLLLAYLFSFFNSTFCTCNQSSVFPYCTLRTLQAQEQPSQHDFQWQLALFLHFCLVSITAFLIYSFVKFINAAEYLSNETFQVSILQLCYFHHASWISKLSWPSWDVLMLSLISFHQKEFSLHPVLSTICSYHLRLLSW